MGQELLRVLAWKLDLARLRESQTHKEEERPGIPSDSGNKSGCKEDMIRKRGIGKQGGQGQRGGGKLGNRRHGLNYRGQSMTG